jgi:Lon protease-like protein
MHSIEHPGLNLPPHVPVMFLPGSVLLPHVLLPLFIFEPRYRTMLEYCLEQHRIFCVAMLEPGIAEVTGPDDYRPICGIGMVRACVSHPDGTSHLVLQGLARVRLGEFIQDAPFRVAEVHELTSIHLEGEDLELPILCERIRDMATNLLPPTSPEREKLQEQLSTVDDPGMLSDIVAHTFIQSPEGQQEVLEELNVAVRVRHVIRHLESQK